MANGMVFNPFTGTLDFVGGGTDPNFIDPVATEAALPVSANQGAICIVKATNQLYEYNNTAWVNVTQKFIDTLGAASTNGLISSQVTNGNGIVETHLALTPADATHPGVLTTGAQTIAGVKTFNAAIDAEGGVDRSGATTLSLGAINAANVVIGTSSSNTTIQSSSVTLDAVAANKVLSTDSAQNIVGTALNNGQILIGSTGAAPTAGNITGTANRVTVSNSAGGITLSGPQDLATTSSPTFTEVYTGNVDTASAGTLGIGFTNATTINIGHSGSTVNIQGTTNTVNVTNYNVANKLMNLNTAGPAASGSGVGVTVEENSIVTGYIETSGDRNSWNLLAPNTAGVVTITPGASGFTINQGSHNPVTIGTANGLSLSTQVLSMALATSTVTGALSSTDWSTFNNKQNALTFGSISDVGTDGISITGGTNAVIGSGVTVAQQVATASQNGYLTSTDWSTFNGKQNALGYTPAHAGANSDITSLSGLTTALSISQGGTGQTTVGAAFTALSPMTTLGDMIYEDATPKGVRLAGNSTTTKQFLSQTGTGSASAAPVWSTITLSDLPIIAGDIAPGSFSAANNQSTAADVTGLAFANGTVRSFEAMVSVYINATASLYERFTLRGIQKGASWDMSSSSIGDSSGVIFSITNAGQIQYQSTNVSGFTSDTIKFRAETTPV